VLANQEDEGYEQELDAISESEENLKIYTLDHIGNVVFRYQLLTQVDAHLKEDELFHFFTRSDKRAAMIKTLSFIS